MFWKLALTAAAILFLSGRTGILRNPLVRLLLPRSWSARLSAVPARWVSVRSKSKAARSHSGSESEPESNSNSNSESELETEPATTWFNRRVRIALLVLGLVGLLAWIVTTWMVWRQSAAGP